MRHSLERKPILICNEVLQYTGVGRSVVSPGLSPWQWQFVIIAAVF